MSVYKEEKTNTWRVIYRYTDWTGQRKQSQKRGFKTKREAQAWEREQMNKATADLDMTFESFIKLYTSNKFISDYTSFCLGIERVARQPYCIMTGTLQFCRNQKVDRKGCSNPKCAIHLNRSIVCFYNGLCQRQAQPNPLRIF